MNDSEKEEEKEDEANAFSHFLGLDEKAMTKVNEKRDK